MNFGHEEDKGLSGPLISVIMNCLNGERYLREALDSVFRQTYSDWEIVFWDNGSSDKSGDIARSYGEKVRYFLSPTTTGLGIARNNAFRQCRGYYIAFLDVDDLWLPHKLARQIRIFAANRNLGLVYCDLTFFNGKGDRYNLFETVTPKRGRVFGDLLARNFIGTATMMYCRKALEALPYLFDERLTLAMDYDLSLRIAYRYELDFANEALAKWRIHSENDSTKRRFLMPKENEIVIEKLRRELPDIVTKYREPLKIFLKSFVHRQLAFEQWEKGNRTGARDLLRPYVNEPKMLFTFLCTFLFPFKIFDGIKTALVSKMPWYLRR